jgi:hypothetical protein
MDTVFLNNLRATADEYNTTKGVEHAARFTLDVDHIKAIVKIRASKGCYNAIIEIENVEGTADDQRAYRDYLLAQLLLNFEDATVNRQKEVFVIYVSWELPEVV